MERIKIYIIQNGILRLNWCFMNKKRNFSHFNQHLCISNTISVPFVKNIDFSKKEFGIESSIRKIVQENYLKTYLDFFPSSIEEYNKCCQKLINLNVKFSQSCVEKGDVMFDNYLLSTNFDIEGFDYLNSNNSKSRIYFNIPKELKLAHLFKNSSQKNISSSYIHYLYKLGKYYKISPNIVKIFPKEGLSIKVLKDIFEGCNIHKILPPSTKYGFWLIYSADKYTYTNLLFKRFSYQKNVLYITPHYQCSNIYPIENRSENIIEIYTRAKELFPPKNVKKAFGIFNYFVVSQRKFNGIIHTISIDDPSKYEEIIFMNGLDLYGTSDYVMSFGDRVSLKNSLTTSIYLKMNQERKEEISKFIDSYEHDYSNEYSYFVIYPRNVKEFNRLNHPKEGIFNYLVNDQKYRTFTYRIKDIGLSRNIKVPHPKIECDINDYLISIFGSIPFLFYEKIKNNIIVNFSSANFHEALFNNKCYEITKTRVQLDSLVFIFPERKKVLLPWVFKIDTICTNYETLHFPFTFKFFRNRNEILPYIKVNFKDFILYAYQEIISENFKVRFKPDYQTVKHEKTHYICNEITDSIFRNILSANNILCTSNDDGTKIYPHFENHDQLLHFMYLYSDINFSTSVKLWFGEEIFSL